MLARVVASIDRLSDGRFDLGLGAGRVWAEIERMGGPTWTPGEAIGAVSEPIDTFRIARGFEDEDGVGGAPGVAPAHRIGIWIGGAGPRMLDLIGRKADGWIAPMATGYETKPAAQDRIDAAAIAAGRDPGAVGRMIQLVGRVTDTASTISRPRSGAGNQAIHTTPEHWARLVAEFAVEERFDTVNFVLEEETSDQIFRFGADVVAAAREARADIAAAVPEVAAIGSRDTSGQEWPGLAGLLTLPAARHRVTVRLVSELDSGAGAPGRRLGRDPPDQARLRQLAEEQAALRRVATLVAQGTPPEEVFAAVAGEVGQLFRVELATLLRYEPGRAAMSVTTWGPAGDNLSVGIRWPLEGHNVSTLVFETGRPARIDRYADTSSGAIGAALRKTGIRSAVGTPVIVEGRLWGVIFAGSTLEQPLPADTEARLASFTELVATAIANTESRAALARLAEEQAALRRVATLVAQGTPPEEVFAAVAEEIGRLLLVDVVTMCRYEPDGTLTYLANWGTATKHFPVGSRWPLAGHKLTPLVFETGRPARIDSFADVAVPVAAPARDMGIRSAVGTPITVQGRLWGVFSAASTQEQPLPPDTEARLASFTELVATAIANTDSRAELMASRARIVAAADETRRRIERDLHDGIQQQLVSLMLDLRAVQAAVPPGLAELEGGLASIAERAAGVIDEAREISHGIHPAILSERGLTPALRALARQSAVPVELDLRTGRRLPGPVEVAAYYAVSEALANAAKHAHASAVHVEVDTPDATLQLAIRDDGIGGADPARGSGLTGLSDRIEALGGTLQVTSPAGRGTTLFIEIPAATAGAHDRSLQIICCRSGSGRSPAAPAPCHRGYGPGPGLSPRVQHRHHDLPRRGAHLTAAWPGPAWKWNPGDHMHYEFNLNRPRCSASLGTSRPAVASMNRATHPSPAPTQTVRRTRPARTSRLRLAPLARTESLGTIQTRQESGCDRSSTCLPALSL